MRRFIIIMSHYFEKDCNYNDLEDLFFSRRRKWASIFYWLEKIQIGLNKDGSEEIKQTDQFGCSEPLGWLGEGPGVP